MKQLSFGNEMSHVKQKWKSKQVQTVSDLEFCWISVVITLGDANLAYTAWEQQRKRVEMTQLSFGVGKFHIQHKWRFKLLSPISDLEFCLDSAAYIALLGKPFYEQKTFMDEAGTRGENLQLLATDLHICVKQNQLANTHICPFGQGQISYRSKGSFVKKLLGSLALDDVGIKSLEGYSSTILFCEEITCSTSDSSLSSPHTNTTVTTIVTSFPKLRWTQTRWSPTHHCLILKQTSTYSHINTISITVVSSKHHRHINNIFPDNTLV